MLYRPKFCSECGETIQRAEWRLTSSRQYCDLCATEYPMMNLLPIVSGAMFVLLLVVGASSALLPGSADNGSTSQHKVANPQASNSGVKATYLKPQVLDTDENDVRSVPAADLPANTSQASVDKSAENVKTDAEVYFCGAPTKKGTPCSRRVKTKGYCWQHNK